MTTFHLCKVLAASMALAIVGCRAETTILPVKSTIVQLHDLPLHTTIPLTFHDNLLFVPTDINGRDVGLFLLDTGSTRNLIDQGIVAQLRLPQTRLGTIVGIGGPEKVSYHRVSSLSIGDLALDATELASLSLGRFQKPIGVSVNGAIGFSALRHVPFTIDYQRLILTVHRPHGFHPPRDEVQQRLASYGGLPTVFATVGQGHRIELLLDTGADAHVSLPYACLLQWPDIARVPVTSHGQSIGIGGVVKQTRTWLSSLKIFGFELQSVPVNFEQSSISGKDGKWIGRVGNGLLQHFCLTFHPAKRMVWVKPRLGDRPP